ncbi:hypothetical protein D3C86_1268280 [compost metagenome]
MEARLGHALDRAGRRLRDVGQGPDRERARVVQAVPRPGRHAAGRLQLRALPRRRRQEDLQVQGQRPDDGRVAALRHAREPELVHVPVAEVGQEPALQRHSARDGRLSVLHRAVQDAGTGQADRQRRLAHPFGPAARERLAGVLRPAAEPGGRGQRLDQGPVVGLFRQVSARRHARERAGAGPSDGLCAELLRGLREALEDLSSARRQGEGGASGPGDASEGPADGHDRRRDHSGRGLCGRQGA